MDDGHLWYLIIAAILAIASAWFSGTEIALATVSKIRMLNYADNGNKRAKSVLYVMDHFEKALTTLLIGNNVVNISCASLVTLYVEKTWGDTAVTVATFITTLVVFFFSEMIPKAFAKECSEKFAMASAKPLIILMKILTPVSFIFTKLSIFIQAPLGLDEEDEEPTVSENELKDIIENIDDEDKIDEDTKDLVKNVMAFTEKTVADVLTPWEKVVSFTAGMTSEQIWAIHREYQYSRYPVVSKSGNPIGLIKIQKYLKKCLGTGKVSLVGVMDKINFADESMPLDELLKKMSGSRIQLVLVKNKSGDIIGAVTIEDLLEEIVGEIYDESDDEILQEAKA